MATTIPSGEPVELHDQDFEAALAIGKMIVIVKGEGVTGTITLDVVDASEPTEYWTLTP